MRWGLYWLYNQLLRVKKNEIRRKGNWALEFLT